MGANIQRPVPGKCVCTLYKCRNSHISSWDKKKYLKNALLNKNSAIQTMPLYTDTYNKDNLSITGANGKIFIYVYYKKDKSVNQKQDSTNVLC